MIYHPIGLYIFFLELVKSSKIMSSWHIGNRNAIIVSFSLLLVTRKSMPVRCLQSCNIQHLPNVLPVSSDFSVFFFFSFQCFYFNLKMFKCVKCIKMFSNKDHLVRYTKIHSNVQFTCEICLKTFARKDNLTKQ
jgi:uncharacterized Zn-finger protein